jgi:steroid 5-alpha reductase family enzyme
VVGLSLLLSTLGLVAAAALMLWLLSLRLRDASVADIFWGPGFALIGLFCAAMSSGDFTRRALVAALAVVWGGRLGLYLYLRNRGKGEDFRYRAMREQHGDRFPLISLGTVFGLQGAVMWIVSLPLQVAASSPVPSPLGWLDAAGLLVWAIGFFFDAVGDLQLARFKAEARRTGAGPGVMDRGLWRYTRHPNYFGDFLVWWGFFLMALGSPSGVYTVLSPLLMSFLLMRVSGVPMLERSLLDRPGYRAYVERTSAFFPRPPRA